MYIYLDIADDGRIMGAAFNKFNDKALRYFVPESFNMEHIAEWRLIDGEFIHTPPKPMPDPLEELTDRIEIMGGAIAELAAIIGGV